MSADIDHSQGFAPPSLDAWRDLAFKSLRGEPFERLISRTADGLEIAPLYTGEPGAGRLASHTTSPVWPGGWDVRGVSRHPDPATANAQILEDLAGGATSILLRVGSGDRDGCAVACASDLQRTLDGVVIESAGVAIDCGFHGPEAAGWLDAFAKRSPGARLAFHLDPLSAFAETGACPSSIGGEIERAAVTGAGLADAYPMAGLFRASGRVIHEAGGSEAQELGVMAAAALAYAKALDGQGVRPAQGLGRIVLGLSLDADVFVSIAKLRAARLIFARLSRACGADTVQARIEACSSDRMLTRLDPWTNLLRLCAAAFAGAVGGADAVALASFTDALGHPSPMARRQARNIQLVLLEESHLGRVADPAAGSWFVESLTGELAREGWGVFQAIERQGGLGAALSSGFIAANLAGPRAALVAGVRANHPGILGVTRFTNPDEAPVAIDETVRQAATSAPHGSRSDFECPPLTPMRLEAAVETIA